MSETKPWDGSWDGAFEGRHMGTQHFRGILRPNPALPDELRAISELVSRLALRMLQSLNDGPELTAGLRKLADAKDCFVRQAGIDTGRIQ